MKNDEKLRKLGTAGLTNCIQSKTAISEKMAGIRVTGQHSHQEKTVGSAVSQ